MRWLLLAYLTVAVCENSTLESEWWLPSQPPNTSAAQRSRHPPDGVQSSEARGKLPPSSGPPQVDLSEDKPREAQRRTRLDSAIFYGPLDNTSLSFDASFHSHRHTSSGAAAQQQRPNFARMPHPLLSDEDRSVPQTPPLAEAINRTTDSASDGSVQASEQASTADSLSRTVQQRHASMTKQTKYSASQMASSARINHTGATRIVTHSGVPGEALLGEDSVPSATEGEQLHTEAAESDLHLVGEHLEFETTPSAQSNHNGPRILTEDSRETNRSARHNHLIDTAPVRDESIAEPQRYSSGTPTNSTNSHIREASEAIMGWLEWGRGAVVRMHTSAIRPLMLKSQHYARVTSYMVGAAAFARWQKLRDIAQQEHRRTCTFLIQMPSRLRAFSIRLSHRARRKATAIACRLADALRAWALRRQRALLRWLSRDPAVSRILRLQKQGRWYSLLKVRRKAQKKELKDAYRKLAKRVHPDKTKDERAQQVRTAPRRDDGRECRGDSSVARCLFDAFTALRDTLDVLLDEKQRKAYDDRLAREELKAAQHRREQRAAAIRRGRAILARLWELALENRRVTTALVIALTLFLKLPAREPPSDL
eukprot:scaffold34274_cov37-Tisochrysis_lutea.AAC.2